MPLVNLVESYKDLGVTGEELVTTYLMRTGNIRLSEVGRNGQR